MLGPAPPGGSLIAGRYLMRCGGWVIVLTVGVFCIALARRNGAMQYLPALVRG